MANIFEDAWNAGKEWATDVKEDAEKYVTKKIIQSKLNDFGTSVTEALGGPTKMTPELEAAGWELGIDNVPYNPQLAKDFAPGGKFYDPDVDRNVAMAQAAQDAGVTSSTPSEAVPFIYQDLRQRTPSGTIYNPSMESFENASLFDYQGPGGLAEYTYGQGLPMGYDVYGTPVGPNLYYEGQFGEGYVEPGVADNAINLPPVTMPGDVPQITTPSTPATPTEQPTQANMPGFTGGGSNDGNQIINNSIGSGMDSGLLVSQADQGPDIGLPGYVNNGTVSAEDQARFDAAKRERFNPTGGPSIYDTQYTVGANNAMSSIGPSIYDTEYTVGANNAMSPIGPSVYDTEYTTVPYQIGGEEQVFDDVYEMQPSDDGTFNYGTSQTNQGNFETANQMVGGSVPTSITRNPNEETQPFRGIYVDPRTLPEIDLVEANQTFAPSFPADYGEGSNLVTITDKPYMTNVPITVDLGNTITEKDFDKMKGQAAAKERLANDTWLNINRIPSGTIASPNPSEARVQSYIKDTPELVKKEVQFPLTFNDRGGIKPQSLIKEPSFNNIITPSGKTRASSGMSIFSAMPPIWMGGL